MDILKQLVDSMSKEEIRHFKLFLQSNTDKTERMDVRLFDYYKKSSPPDDDKIFDKLYKKSADKNPFYRLKNRLQEDIALSLTVLHSDKNETSNLLKNMSLFHLYYSRQQYQLALYFLKRAEKSAVASRNLEMLDLIYASFIKLSNDFMEINPEKYISLRTENAITLSKIRSMDQLLTMLNFRLKTTQNYNAKDKGLLKIVEKTTKEFLADEALKEDKEFQTRIYKAISSVMVQQHNFKELEEYAMLSFDKFSNNSWFNKANHELKLQMLIYIINAKFYNAKFHESLQYVQHLHESLMEFDKLHYEKYLFFLYNSYVANYSRTNFREALNKLEEFERLMRQRKSNYYDQFIYLNKATLLFEIRKYNDAIRNLMKLYVSPTYEKIDESFRLKIEVAELIMQYESGDLSALKKRFEQVRKRFPILSKKEFLREAKLILLIENLSVVGRLKSSDKLVKDINRFIEKPVNAIQEDGEIIKYRQWLTNLISILKK